MNRQILEPAFQPADAGRRNMLLLTQLRWLAVGGQLVTVAVVQFALGIDLPMTQLLMSTATLAALNIASHVLIASGARFTDGALAAALLFDVGALTVQLSLSGGITNPFAALFLLHIVLGAVLLRPHYPWTIVAATLIALGILALDPTPLVLPPDLPVDPVNLYLGGGIVCFVLIAVLLVIFIGQISRNLRTHDAALAAVRQRAAEEDHIVRMGLLASGAAHELGTPLSLLSVAIGDWRAMPRLKGDKELQEELAEMDGAVRRCKAIVSGILMSAGEARGVAPEVTSVRRFLTEIVADYRASLLPGTLDFDDRFGADVTIVSDPALRQVIGNVIDNAIEVSPGRVALTVLREGEALVLDIADRGPGFAPEILETFGQPYRSTKGKPGGGLGLFLLVNVLRKLGGEASAENRLDGGARVRIVLPLAALAMAARR
ncbi:ATP-binding protein [Sphingomonas sp. R647]|uniref:ATP-binding protein n=1 Tax=Sphingomonas sp. R647 TaxID=2875233 RepID=UPI00296F27F4|nr:ATP-binding protein [Sphingomonas sp. R647]